MSDPVFDPNQVTEDVRFLLDVQNELRSGLLNSADLRSRIEILSERKLIDAKVRAELEELVDELEAAGDEKGIRAKLEERVLGIVGRLLKERLVAGGAPRSPGNMPFDPSSPVSFPEFRHHHEVQVQFTPPPSGEDDIWVKREQEQERLQQLAEEVCARLREEEEKEDLEEENERLRDDRIRDYIRELKERHPELRDLNVQTELLNYISLFKLRLEAMDRGYIH